MDTNAMDLSDFFKTRSEAVDFSSRLSSITEKIYQTNFDLEQTLMDTIGIQKKEAFIKLVRDNNIKPEVPSDLKAFIDKLQAKIPTIPVISLAIAFEPKEQTLKAFSEWFVLNIGKQVIFDIVIDPQLIAGAAITINGKFYDQSIRTQFAQILKDVVSPQPTQHKNQN